MAKINKSRMKTLVLLAVAITAIFVYLNFAGWVKNITEEIASDALGVKVKIASIDISLQDKKVTVSGIKIANPKGYKSTYAITTDKIIVGLNDASKEMIDFKNIEVHGTVINLEVTSNGSNLGDLKKLASGKPKSQPQSQSTKSENDVRVIIRKMLIKGSTLNPTITLLGDQMGSIKIPPVSLSGIGVRENGVLAKDAISQILTKYISTAEKQASSAGFFKGIDAVKNVKDTAQKTIKNIGDNIGKNLGGLFGK